jgi:peptide/nickel transport system substrate-binding protein
MKLQAILLAAALAAGASAPLLAQAQTLRWAAQNDILTLDPHSQNHSTTNAIVGHTYETLVRYNATYQIEPALATKWTQVTPTQVRFELRKGVKFHDGTPFTADDVVFSFGRIKQPTSTTAIYVAGVNEVKKIDDHTVDFILAGPNPLVLRNATGFFIMSKAWSEKNNTVKVQDYKAKEENFASRNAMGTGPYKITGWMPEQRVTMTINNDWWDKHTSNVKEVIYTPIKSDPTRVAALLSGDVDMLTDLPTQDVARLRSDPKLKIVDGPEVRTIFLAPDVGSAELKYSNVKGKNPFADKRVRQALSMAIDREAIKRSTMRGLSIPAGVMVAPGVNGNAPRTSISSPSSTPKAPRSCWPRPATPTVLKCASTRPTTATSMTRRSRRTSSRCGRASASSAIDGREHGHLQPEVPELRLQPVHAGLGRADL